MPTIYVVEEQSVSWLFASKTEAEAFDSSRYDRHRYSRVVPLGEQHRFNPEDPDCSLEVGPNQQKCRRILRHVNRWWKARDAWWASLGDTN